MKNPVVSSLVGRSVASLALVALLGGCSPQIIRSETVVAEPYPLQPGTATTENNAAESSQVASVPPKSSQKSGEQGAELPSSSSAEEETLLAAGSIFAEDPDEAKRQLEAQERDIIAEAQIHIIAAVQHHQAGDMQGTLAEFEMAEAALQGLEDVNGQQVVAVLQDLLPEEMKGKDLLAIYDDALGAEGSQEAAVDVESLVEGSGKLGGPQGLGEPSAEETTPVPVAKVAPVEIEEEPVDNVTFIRTEIDRIAKAFGETEVLQHDTFQREVERFIHYYQTDKRGFFDRSLARSVKYMPMVESILEEKGVPPEMAFIAFVESGFRPGATSPASARGLWQFMPRTARAYGLQVDNRVDQRTDPYQSTIAAREYFLDLVAIFGSRSFLLAMASYNAGEGRVQGCLKALDDPFTQRTFWHISPCLRRETQEYIPRIIAAAIIASEPERFGFAPFGTIGTADFEVVGISKPVSLARLARWSDISVGRLREMNPDLSKSATSTPKNQHPYLMVVPGEAAALVREELLQLKAGAVVEGVAVASVPTSEKTSEESAKKTQVRTPAPDKAAPKPAPQAIKQETDPKSKESRTTKQVSKKPEATAKGEKSETRSRKKSEAKVNKKSTADGRTKYIRFRVPAKADLEQIAEDFEKDVDELVGWNPYLNDRDPKAGDIVFIYDLDWSYQRHNHQVAKGETLLAISQRYGAPADQIARWNGVDADKIYEGQSLVVYTHDGQQVARRSPSKETNTTTQRQKFIYIVQVGNNLTRLSGYFGVSPEDIRTWNKLESDEVQVGEKLTLYTDKPVEVITHKVESGESLGSLSRKYNVVLTFLVDTNGLARDAQLKVGQVLTIYVPE